MCVPVCTVCVVNEKTDGSQADGSNEQPLAVGGAGHDPSDTNMRELVMHLLFSSNRFSKSRFTAGSG